MFEKNIRCPSCDKCIGVFNSSDAENSIAKVSLSKPNQIGYKASTMETKCPRCKKIFYITLGFKN